VHVPGTGHFVSSAFAPAFVSDDDVAASVAIGCAFFGGAGHAASPAHASEHASAAAVSIDRATSIVFIVS
jgi:hypothetical protein